MNTATLGTLLRHLIELLDSAVEQQYANSGLSYRPRYTPVMRALLDLGPASIRAIARHAGITHSAVSQTVAQMAKQGLIRLEPGGELKIPKAFTFVEKTNSNMQVQDLDTKKAQ